MTDHYQTLGVPREATQDDIRAAFRRLASQHHPDRGGDPKAMAAVNKAHDVLGDPERRKLYDETGQGGDLSVAEQAQALLAQLFANALTQEAPILDVVREGLDGQRTEATEHRSAAAKRITKLKARRPTVKAKGQNLVHNLIDQQVSQLEAQVGKAAWFLLVVAEAERMLAEYESTEVAPPLITPTIFRRQFTGTGAGSW